MNQMLSRPSGSSARFACPTAMSPRPGATTSKSAVVRGAVEREAQGLAGKRPVVSGPAGDPDLHVQEDLILVAAVGLDATGEKHPLGLVERATENAATIQALLDNLVERGLDPAVVRLFIIDGAKALSKAIRRTFGRNTPIQRCQVSQGPEHCRASAQGGARHGAQGSRQAWEMEEGRTADPEPAAGQGMSRHRRHHPGGTG
jgi:putative transposase